MLKRLELVGFKSFADKTTFDFSQGITGIVGPNGSGKSNIVDAVRWLLGEQSAKSLRGGEMTDVIFNGSASRRSFGLAEVTITFDNARKLLATDAEEVQITRRVYRSGEGEYLINHQQCRLKDIKDLFLGSGAGSNAYSIIAQGQVDVMLQASSKERRTIFEEAAGISRFKVKKIETLRKLERVDLNVQRLKDIIEEVEKQLRSVKLQAAKAQRYQEHSKRLKELRVGLGLQEFHLVSQKLQTEQTSLESLRHELEEHGSQVHIWEDEHQKLEETLTQLEEELHQAEAVLSNARQQIGAHQATLQHEHDLSDDLQDEQSRLRQQVNELSEHLSGLLHSLQAAQNELDQAQAQAQNQRDAADELAAVVRAAEEQQETLQQQVQTDKAGHLEQMRQAARLHNDAVSYKAQIDNLQRELQRLRLKTEQAAESLASLDDELEEMTEAEATLQERLQQARRQLAAEQEESERLRRTRDEKTDQISTLRQDRSGLISRAEVLEGLERSHEGLGSGVGEILDLLDDDEEKESAGPWKQCIMGMVADFLTVRREYAPLIDLALGDLSQRFLVRNQDLLLQALLRRSEPFSGRVSFLPVPEKPRQRHAGNGEASAGERHFEFSLMAQRRNHISAPSLPEHAGIVARADQLVTCDDDELQDLPSCLLGQTVVVRDLETARQLASTCPGFRLITLKGELLEPDGTMTVGTHHADTGILSRKSELREIRELIESLDGRITNLERDLNELREQLAVSESRVQNQQQEIQVLGEQLADMRSRLEMHRNRRQGLHEEVTISRDEISRVEEEIASLQLDWQQAQEQAAEAEQQVHLLQNRIEQAEAAMRQLANDRQQRHQEWTAQKVELAKTEERVSSLQAKYQQLRTGLEQRQHEHNQAEQNLQGCQARLLESQQTMLRASSTLALWYVAKENAQRKIARLHEQRDRDRVQRNTLAERLQNVRGQWQAQNEQYHHHQLQANELRHQRRTLLERLREDYQLDLTELYQQAVDSGLFDEKPDEDKAVETAVVAEEAEAAEAPLFPWQIPADPDTANEEINDLKGKLQRLGSVNLDSLQELSRLELRAETLNTQYEDLTSAKRSLEDIIATINNDSERLFLESFEMIRGHFQELFRKLFGGGMADVILEDENDILECGIEIIARPPGKELRSISLMSGGEKTLTAVALLLAIFRSKPSPFCILDEVDAALDEANIGRFADVLREFLDHSHFIIITHAKRTMAAADVIYGITMQESGISKRVSVRFEDWEENGAKVNGVPEEARQQN